jgi:hypothetical protein
MLIVALIVVPACAGLILRNSNTRLGRFLRHHGF